ncbi:hypothetical protein [Streptomyces ipomoeae]|uniref:hypothetical protein n=1 Tax=Streptomyces ipomoeae TaxID=103232 RepID=UPI0015F0A0DB|nr:hypothetical protein [Streptomyces ipomoeae]MDX2931823.1 hypothetical protein [Streptomyces ipomoeae]
MTNVSTERLVTGVTLLRHPQHPEGRTPHGAREALGDVGAGRSATAGAAQGRVCQVCRR